MDFIFLLVAVVGIGFLSYPFYADYKLSKSQTMSIRTYETKVKKLDQKEIANQKKKLEEDNEKQEQKTNTKDPFGTTNKIDVKKTKLPAVVGILEIPKINLKVQIYPTTNEMALEKGVGVLEGSSLPVGGVGKHSVITGHRGLSLGKMFTDLPDIKNGNHFYIKVLKETHAYKVDQIKTITPEDMSHFEKSPMKDYVTLVTCTPLGINSHRLLVRGHRVPYNPSEKDKSKFWTFKHLLMAGIAGIVFLLLMSYLIQRYRKRNKKRGLNKT